MDCRSFGAFGVGDVPRTRPRGLLHLDNTASYGTWCSAAIDESKDRMTEAQILRDIFFMGQDIQYTVS